MGIPHSRAVLINFIMWAVFKMATKIKPRHAWKVNDCHLDQLSCLVEEKNVFTVLSIQITRMLYVWRTFCWASSTPKDLNMLASLTPCLRMSVSSLCAVYALELYIQSTAHWTLDVFYCIALWTHTHTHTHTCRHSLMLSRLCYVASPLWLSLRCQNLKYDGWLLVRWNIKALKVGWNNTHWINQSNIYSVNIPSEARLSGATAEINESKPKCQHQVFQMCRLVCHCSHHLRFTCTPLCVTGCLTVCFTVCL